MKRLLSSPDDYRRIADFVLPRIGGNLDIEKFSAIGLESDGKVVAGVIYTGYNKSSIAAGVAGEGGHWLTPDFLWFMFYYPFMQLGVGRVTCYVETHNIMSQKFVTKLGFELESVMKRAGASGGDLLVFRLFKENCRYLERRRHEQKISPAHAA